jgi:sigma-B regulation protein RsbU (phosphoserine phosphatase)
MSTRHNRPLIFRGAEVIRLETGGPVVGLLPMFVYSQGSIQLQGGDTLVAFTDGISEAMNAADEEWGEENLIECVRNAADLTARDLIVVHTVPPRTDLWRATNSTTT